MNDGLSLVRGVNYKYNNVGTGPYDVIVKAVGDSDWVGYTDTGLPHVTADSWRTLRFAGPTYLVDNDPEIHFIGSDPSDNCLSLTADTPSYGHSYYDIGSGWTLDTEYEYVVELIYEPVLEWGLDPDESTGAQQGSITPTDNIDAYLIIPWGGQNYTFILDRTSGSGNLNVRIVTYQDLTSDTLVQTYRPEFPKKFNFGPPNYDNYYILLVEAENVGVDIANYTLQYFVNEQHYQWTKDMNFGVGWLQMDNRDNLYLAGYTYASEEAILVKYDPNGIHLWNQTWERGSHSRDGIKDLTIDGSDNIYVLSSLDSSLNLRKINSAGTQLWVKDIQVDFDSNYDPDYSPISISGGNVEGVCITGLVASNAYLGKYDASGNQLWNTTWTYGTVERPLAVTVDATDNVYITGMSHAHTLPNPSNTGYLAKFDFDGQFLWRKTWDVGENFDQEPDSIVADNVGNTYVGGVGILRKYNSSGDIQWSRAGPGEFGKVYGMTFDKSGNIFITGGTGLFDLWDAPFLMKYNQLGNGIWGQSQGGVDVVVDSLENVFIAREELLLKYGKTPAINVVLPTQNAVFGELPPNFEIIVTDPFLDKIWYIMDGESSKHPLLVNKTAIKGNLTQDVWDNVNDGQELTITFSASDMAGFVSSKNVSIHKDISPPSITIISPRANEKYLGGPPRFEVLITDPHLDHMWYSLDGGVTNYFFTENETIAEEAWKPLEDGQPVTITFYANDTIGHLVQKDVLVEKKAKSANGFTGPAIAMSLIVVAWRKRTKKRKIQSSAEKN
ncbi:MAG: hypothetical protein ACFE9L_00195 [Candidatus Hodarchaeota archaeon]